MIKINKSLKKIICFIILILVFISIVIFIFNNVEIEKVEEIEPELEISEEDSKKVNVKGYVLNKETCEIQERNFLLSQKEILDDMYKNILNLVIVKDDDENKITVNEIIELNIDRCEENLGVLSIYFTNNISSFESLDENNRRYIVEIITKTMMEINEVVSIKFYFNNIEYIPNI